MKFEANCRTTAMGIMPHTDIERALDLALSLDIPFWPQLPNLSFYEDMYVQATQHFPGVSLGIAQERIHFDTSKFYRELDAYSRMMEQPQSLGLTPEYSKVYHRFLERDLGGYPSIRGQLTGPVSLGFRITDEDIKPIIYNESVRTILFDFIQRKANVQYQQLKEKNENAFVWLDEPGLGWVFSGLAGYLDIQARQDYQDFLRGLEGPKAIHLCANVNLPYLLSLGVELLSFDAYQIEVMPLEYAAAVGEFIREGNVISWGIVPTDSESLGKETPQTLASLLSGYWERVAGAAGLSLARIARQALIAPARCMLKNIGQVGAADEALGQADKAASDSSVEEILVEKAFAYLGEVSRILRREYGLPSV